VRYLLAVTLLVASTIYLLGLVALLRATAAA
jgi:hypothetical protein